MSEEFVGQVSIAKTPPTPPVAIGPGGPPFTIQLDADTANITAGGHGTDGDILLRGTDNAVTVRLDGQQANLRMGGAGADGDILLFPNAGNQNADGTATIHLDGNSGNITVRDSAGNPIFRFEAGFALLDIGGQGNEGDIRVRDNGDNVRIHLDGNSGDIKLSGADFAEEFDVAESERVEPGTVMVFDQEGIVRQSREAYDKKVAGVISGAGGYRPGIVMDKQHGQSNRIPLAVLGKVYCKVDAQYSPIEVGELLTTSPTAGHAMKAGDPLKAFGAVIGKALYELKEGRGLIPMLVSLQ